MNLKNYTKGIKLVNAFLIVTRTKDLCDWTSKQNSLVQRLALFTECKIKTLRFLHFWHPFRYVSRIQRKKYVITTIWVPRTISMMWINGKINLLWFLKHLQYALYQMFINLITLTSVNMFYDILFISHDMEISFSHWKVVISITTFALNLMI